MAPAPLPRTPTHLLDAAPGDSGFLWASGDSSGSLSGFFLGVMEHQTPAPVVRHPRPLHWHPRAHLCHGGGGLGARGPRLCLGHGSSVGGLVVVLRRGGASWERGRGDVGLGIIDAA